MNLLQRLFAARPAPPRVEPRLAPAPRNAIATSWADMLEIGPGATGRAVTEASAMRVAAVYACVRIIAIGVALCPVVVFRRQADGSRQREENADLWWLFNEQPHPRWTSHSMWEYLIKSVLLRGDGFARIGRNRAGAITWIEPLNPAGVMVEVKAGRLRYFYTDDEGRAIGLDQDDVLHFPGFAFDGCRGMSVIRHAANQGVGIALATEEFSARFFGSGAMVKHVLTSPAKMGDELKNDLRRQWDERYTGLDNAWKPLVLTEGLDIKELSLSAQDSQLLEARKFQVIDIARAFGVPPVMIGETEKTTSWGSGVEQMAIWFARYTLSEHLRRMAQEINRKCIRTAARFVEFDLRGLLTPDSQGRAKFLREALGGSQGPGWMTLNEIRREENLPPRDDGDAIFEPKGGMDAPTADATAQG